MCFLNSSSNDLLLSPDGLAGSTCGTYGISWIIICTPRFSHRIILRFLFTFGSSVVLAYNRLTLSLSVLYVYTYRLTCVITKVRSEVSVGSHMNVFCIACSTIELSVLTYRCVDEIALCLAAALTNVISVPLLTKQLIYQRLHECTVRCEQLHFSCNLWKYAWIARVVP